MNAQNRYTRKQSTSVLLRNFYVGITPWYGCILDAITGGNFLGSHTFDSYDAMLDLFGPPPLLVNGTILTLEHVMQRLEIIKNKGKYLRYFAASSLPLQGKPTQCSRGSKKDFWRRCWEGLRSIQDIPSTQHKFISLALHYLPFASRFPLPHFTIAVLFALSFPFASFSLACRYG